MSEQIREQVSAFLDGELPNSETELLLKRLTRDSELRESFGRFALIGEALRGASSGVLTRSFALRVNHAIDGEPVVQTPVASARVRHWWRPVAGVTVAAGVATVAIVALQQRAIAPGLRVAASPAPQVLTAPQGILARQELTAAQSTPAVRTGAAHEALSYTVPASSPEPAAMAPARLTNYVFAHSKYSSGLGQRGVLADLLIEDDGLQLPPQRAQPPVPPEVRDAP
jgi:sigma-E factor negative regulatory protein RseA